MLDLGETDVELENIEEDWNNGSIKEVTVKVKHDSSPHNMKTFRFSINGNKAELEEMNMDKGNAWTWSEQEINSLPDAFKLAKQVAEERAELDDVL